MAQFLLLIFTSCRLQVHGNKHLMTFFRPEIVRDQIFAFLLMSREGPKNSKSGLQKAYLAYFDKYGYLSSCYF